MDDTLVSKKVAILAQNKGFNWPVTESFVKGISKPNTLHNSYDFNNDKNFAGRISRPTQSHLNKWLRDVHKVYLQPHLVAQFQLSEGWGYELTYSLNGGLTNTDEDRSFATYEKALEDGLIKALKTLPDVRG